MLLKDLQFAMEAPWCYGAWCQLHLVSSICPAWSRRLQPALPDHDAVGRALLCEDRACGVAHSDVVWSDPDTGAALHVGSEDAAFDIAFLRRSKILRVANCTGNIPNFHEGEADLLYYRLNVSRYRSRLDDDTANEFFHMPRFVSDGLRGATAVLVLCRAGRRRAGVVAHACVMWFADQSLDEATTHLRRHRPQIELTDDFVLLMRYLESRLRQRPSLHMRKCT